MHNLEQTKPFKGLRALVVDDSDAARDILGRILERAGFEVLTANDGEQAIEITRKDPAAFDVALIDLVMTKVDGVTTIRNISRLQGGSRVPLIPMSASITPDIERDCGQAGAYPATLRKPYRAEQVSDLLAKALNRSPARVTSSVASLRRNSGLQLQGCDVEGAIDRCGGDIPLYRKLVFGFQSGGAIQIEQAIEQLRHGDLTAAITTIHNLRGEMLNLGMVELVASLLSILSELTPGSSPLARSVTLGSGGKFAHQAAKLSNLRQELFATLQRIQHLPALSHIQEVGSAAGTVVPGKDENRSFATLTSLMSVNDPMALALLPAQGPILPAHYDQAQQDLFRSHFDGLEFEAALQILRPQDIDREPIASTPEGFRILVVDDAAVTVRLLCRALEGMGALRFALSGERAFEIANRWRPDLVISDVSMGGISGIELCRRIKSVPELSDCTVMLISASDDVAVEVEGLTAGAVDFIEKPLNTPRIVARVSAQLAMLRQRAETSAMHGAPVHNSASGFITCDLTGQVLAISPSLARWLGRPTEPQPGLLAQDLFDPAFFSIIDQAIRTHSRGGRIGPFETAMTSTTGGRLPVRLIGRDMPGYQSRVLWFGVEDISVRIRSERSRNDAQLHEKIDVLASGIAHEFNNLLGVVIGRIDMAIDLNKDPSIAAHLSRANEAALRAATISRSLRGSAEQRSRGDRGVYSVAALLQQYWPVLRNLVPNSIALEHEIADSSLSIQIDPNDLLDMLMRTIENAAEASATGGRILVKVLSADSADTGSDAGSVLLEIQDQGVGMSEHAVSNAFQAFYTTKTSGRAGLGLSDVATLAERNSAQVSIESKPGLGTTVRIAFARA